MGKQTNVMRSALLLLPLLGAVACNGRSEPELKTGPWRAWLDTLGGELPFELEIWTEMWESPGLCLIALSTRFITAWRTITGSTLAMAPS